MIKERIIDLFFWRQIVIYTGLCLIGIEDTTANIIVFLIILNRMFLNPLLGITLAFQTALVISLSLNCRKTHD